MKISLFAAFGLLVVSSVACADSKREALWTAVRNADEKAIKKAIDDGADVNARNEYGVTALWIASGKKKFEVVKLLVDKGADVNARDDIWYQTPLSSAIGAGDMKTVELLIKSGAKDTDAAFVSAVMSGKVENVESILKLSKIGQDALDASLHSAIPEKLKKILKDAGGRPLPKASEADQALWKKMAGRFESDGGARLALASSDVGLLINNRVAKKIGPDVYSPLGSVGAEIRIEHKDGDVSKVTMKRLTAEYSFYKFKEPTVAAAPTETAANVSAAMNWPSFRGPNGTGVADGQHPPVKWDVKKKEGVLWKTPIDGMGHSCPVVWGNRIFITTAISTSQKDQSLKVGNYGDVGSVDDISKHTWQVMCLERDTGKILWTKTAFEGKPKIKRHLKGSQANCTPAVDGKHVVACFGSEGLFCYDFDGQLIWKRDLSTLDSSFALDKEYEWGFGNSPILHDGKCILQCDLSRDSFIAAFDLKDGNKIWSTPRDEIPSWSSPVIWKNSVRTEIVTNAAQYARGYDPDTGAELWRIAKKSEVTVPTPVLGEDLAYISSGNRPIQPIIAVKPGASGDISLPQGKDSSGYVAWSKLRGGPYMPTPILYKDHLYTCSNSGVIACYDAKTGKEFYKERVGGTGSYTASPVAADGRIYVTSEQGEVRVFKAGPKFELIAVNPLDDLCMATPAVSNGAIFFRTHHFMIAVGKK
jgi:outer membrane protein assembly factor BamB